MADKGIRNVELSVNLNDTIGQINSLSNLLTSSITEINNSMNTKASQAQVDTLSSNITSVQTQVNQLEALGTLLGSVTHYSDITVKYTNPQNRDWVIVTLDENFSTNPLPTTKYFWNGTSWNYAGEMTVNVRNFTTNPINLTSEVTNVLPKANMDLTDIATTTQVNNKIDKIVSPFQDNIVLQNSDGTLKNSGKKVTDYIEKNTLSTVATSGSYSDLINRPILPSKTSDLVNNSNFIRMNNNGDIENKIYIQNISPNSTGLQDKDIFINTSTNPYTMSVYNLAATSWVQIGGNGNNTGTTIQDWTANTAYLINTSFVIYNNILYRCSVSHTSTNSFDLTKWLMIGKSMTVGVKNDNTVINSCISNLNFVGAIVTDEGDGQVKIQISGGSALPYNVNSFIATLNALATQITYNWTNPTIQNGYVKTTLFISTEDITASDYNFCITNTSGNIQKVKDNGIQGASDSYVFTCTKNLTYYAKIFVVYDFGNGNVYSGGKSLSTIAVDTTPPSNPTNIQAVAGNGKITISWIDPTDTDLAGIMVRWKTSAFSTNNKSEGNLLADVGKGIQSIIHDGLNNTGSPTYYYKIFPYDNSSIANYNTSNSNICSATLDGTPPEDVGTITKLELNQSIKVTWQNNDNSSSDWKGIRLVIKQGNDYPTNITDGTYVDIYNINTKTYTFGGLINNQKYSIQLFPFDNNLNYNTNSVNQIQGTPIASALSDLISFSAENLINGTEVNLSYTLNFAPNGTTYQSTKIYASKTVNLDGKTPSDCVSTSGVFLLKTDTTTTQGSSTSFIHYNNNANLPFSLGDTVYYKAFMTYQEGSSMGISLTQTIQDLTPLTNVTGLVTSAGDTQNVIQWINPHTSIDNDFAKVQIFRKVGTAYPDGMNDLEKVYESTNQNIGNLNTFTDTELTNNTTYSYIIKLIDNAGNININTKFQLTPVAQAIYGVSYNASTNTWTRLNLANGLNSSDFNNIRPWSTIKRCLFTDAKVKSYLKSTDSTLLENGTSADITSGSSGNVFSEYEKYYYKYEYVNGEHKWYISMTQYTGFSTHKAFIRNSVEKPYLWIGTYQGFVNTTTNKLESLSGKTPTITGHSFSDFRTLAQARGSGFDQFDSLSLHLLQVLFIIKYANADYSTIIGSGTDLGTVNTTGLTNSLGNSDGSSGTSTSLFGVENLVNGGTHSIVEGLIASSNYYWQADHGFGTMTSESSVGNYSQLSSTITPITTNGFIKNVEQINSAFIGKDVTGSSSTGFYDYQLSKNGTGLNVLFIGGGNDTNKKGLFNNEFLDISNMSINSNFVDTTSSNTNITAGKEYTVANFDKTAYSPKEISTITFTDDTTTPFLTINEVLNNISGRLICY